jgi:probable F420-dependent oxidoreductase
MASKIELGSVGAVVQPSKDRASVDAAVELERLGFPSVWVIGGPLEDLSQLRQLVEATQTVRIASGIIAADRFAVDDVAAFYTEIEAARPGRFVLGLGGARGPDSFATLNAYLDRLDELGVPASARIMAALGPRSLDLARNRAAGVFPVLVTPEYIARARERLGDGPILAVEQFCIIETDAEQAREVARSVLSFMSRLPRRASAGRASTTGRSPTSTPGWSTRSSHGVTSTRSPPASPTLTRPVLTTSPSSCCRPRPPSLSTTGRRWPEQCSRSWGDSA